MDVAAVSLEDGQTAATLVGQGLQITASATDANTWSVRATRTITRNIVRASIFGIVTSLIRIRQPNLQFLSLR